MDAQRRKIHGWFPKLTNSFKITSEFNRKYNCIAWALGIDDVWWEPDSKGTYFWPPSAPRVLTIEAFILAFAYVGFVQCDHDDYEPGFEKIALFADAVGKPTHVARQLPSGNWTSKLGREEDIETETLAELTESDYGEVVAFLRHPRESS